MSDGLPPRTPREVVRTYLEMRDPAALRGESLDEPGLRVRPCAPCTTATYRALYGAVGAAYAWRDRDAWTDDALAAYLARPGVAVWILVDDAATDPAGYFELVRHDDGAVEIAYFGVDARWHGRRLGARLLTAAVREAWAMGATRVWLHTCTLDAPAALPNYLARGFAVTHREAYLVDLGV